MKRTARIIVASFLFAAFGADAATWQAVRGINGIDGVAYPFLHPGGTFEDGQHTWLGGREISNSSVILADYPLSELVPPSQTPDNTRIVAHGFVFAPSAPGEFSRPPQVDLVKQTIDLSSLWVIAFQQFDYPLGEVRQEAIFGWKPAAKEPVAFVTNTDGSFTANWVSDLFNLGNSYAGGNYQQMSLTFQAAPPIPEPAAIWLMGAGIGLLGWVMRRRRTD